MNKSYATVKKEEKKKKGGGGKHTKNWNCIQEFQCFQLIISIHQISSCIYFVQQHIPTVIWLGLITFHCLNSSTQRCADIPALHAAVDTWWHEINLIPTPLPYTSPCA